MDPKRKLAKQSGDLVLLIEKKLWQAAIDQDRERHDRLDRIFDKIFERHGRRCDALRS